MIIDSKQNDFKMTKELKTILKRLRLERGFDTESYLSKKIKSIHSYLESSSITHIVIGISGGVDSAVSLSILNKLKKEVMPDLTIVPVFLPSFGSSAVSGQSDAHKMATLICNKVKLSLTTVDLTDSVKSLSDSIYKSLNLSNPSASKAGGLDKPNDWAVGQLVSYMRTPSFYYVTTLINQTEGNLAVTATNINASEGQMIGYFGKSGDSMADLQLISDLFKSEVYALAQHFDVPSEIINRKPLPDMFDGKDDETIFGFPYDFLELYQMVRLLSDLNYKTSIDFMKSELNSESLNIFNVWEENLGLMHKYNKHKYLGHSPSIHFDVIDSKIAGGWKYYIWDGVWIWIWKS